jgi:hypothetical protein
MNTGGKTAKEPGLDKATIDAMRAVVEGCEGIAKAAEASIYNRAFLGRAEIPTADFRLAVDAVRSLIDQAAERAEGEAVNDEAACPPSEALIHVRDGLKQAVASASRNGDEYVRISVENSSYGLFPSTAAAAARAIDELLAAQPAKPEPAGTVSRTLRDLVVRLAEMRQKFVKDMDFEGASVIGDAANVVRKAIVDDEVNAKPEPAEPTLEECVAAMNRAKIRGNTDWHILIASKADNLRFFYDETFAIGRMLIERERAAKGGAA